MDALRSLPQVLHKGPPFERTLLQVYLIQGEGEMFPVRSNPGVFSFGFSAQGSMRRDGLCRLLFDEGGPFWPPFAASRLITGCGFFLGSSFRLRRHSLFLLRRGCRCRCCFRRGRRSRCRSCFRGRRRSRCLLLLLASHERQGKRDHQTEHNNH